ncbi:S-adenosyl-L-methionine-dependent methyltransferase [Lasiosphaeria miniovina]|uniref:S-adenosyl-L-methionine-dependent methyltransferase n=1 Tax=Lasiosphaeria miniovina TaxID=1954250 RepID=A0AA40DM94_9PEZI|nr:S-adenosyl-L-methionine-dependent methyltransferase [Lasiosphaeria miniovina]KAK0706012.1 S-adenosyl-L-methionine-dependent methyltransferase [Lasiosphaeria miniovina]
MAALLPEPSDTPSLVNSNPQLQTYYHSFESRIGYRLLLGGTRHFGYWNRGTYWPFPLSTSLRAMEDKLAEALALPRGAHVLDAGCGVGHVALRMAQAHGLRISAIDIVDHHITKARRNISRSGLPNNTIAVHKMDYHHLESLADESLDGAYTMETFVHATDPEAVLAGFYRLLRPGGRVAHFEYDHELVGDAPEDMAASMRKINQYAAMPTNHRSHPGVFKQMLEEAGFEDVVVRDFSENIKPMTRLFFVLAIVPYVFVRLLGLERYFINTIAGVESYRGRGRWRYVAITATKPGGPLELAKAR